MKPKSYKQIILFLIILPLFLAVILPFFVILKIAFIPEGLAKSDNKALIIWEPSKNYNPQWKYNNADFSHESIKAQEDIYESFSWDLKNEDSYFKWIHKYAQNFLDFRNIVIKLNSSVPEIILGFKDIHDKETSCVVKIKKTDSWTNITCPLNNFDLKKIDKTNIKHFFITVKKQSSGTLMIKKIFCPYRLFTISNFKEVLSAAFFGRYFLNSAFIAIIIMITNILFSTMAGFAFAFGSFPLRKTFFAATLLMIMIPVQVLMIPTFIIIQNLGWLNTYKALIIPFMISPINIFLMKQYISKIPRDYAEVALVNGASYFQIFFKVILPMCKPALAVVGINTFVTSWNSFLYPFILTNTAEMRTIPVGLALYIGLYDVDWAHLMAASSLSAVPVMIVFLCFQKQIVEGMLYGTGYQT